MTFVREYDLTEMLEIKNLKEFIVYLNKPELLSKFLVLIMLLLYLQHT